MTRNYDFAAEHRLAMGKPVSAEAYSGMDEETMAAAIEEIVRPPLIRVDPARKWFKFDLSKIVDRNVLVDPEQFCHCGKDGHPLGSINCQVHGLKNQPAHTLPGHITYVASEDETKIAFEKMSQDGLRAFDRIAGMRPLCGTEPKPLALSRDTRHYGPEIPVTAFKRWER
jgi:hypothetical protein